MNTKENYTDYSLLLLDYNLDNIHNIVNNLINNVYYIIIDDYNLENIKNKIKNTNVDTFNNIGLLFLSYDNINLLLPDILNNNNNIDILNNNIDIINTTNYSKYINIEWKYNNIIDTISYQEQFISNNPIFYNNNNENINFFGGTFSIDTNDLQLYIDNSTGIFKITGSEIGLFNITINYLISNIKLIKNITIICKPLIIFNKYNYDLNYGETIELEKPLISPYCNGLFYITNDTININSQTGIITINKNINSGLNLIDIYFSFNNIITQTQLQININTFITYTNSYIEIYYGNNYISDGPINNTDITNSIYTLTNKYDNINIDSNTGIITTNNLNTGLYNLQINYGIYSTNITINIKPYFIYTTNEFDFGTNFSDLPIIKSNINNYNFSIESDYSNISINNNTGILSFNNILVGNYEININLMLDNIIITTILYKLVIKPIIYYNPNNLNINLNVLSESIIPIVNPPMGNFTIDNNNNKITIDNKTGKIIFNNIVDIGHYSIIVNYKYNSIVSTYIYYLYVNPTIEYIYNKKNINYNYIGSIGCPLLSHLGGLFTLINSNPNININNNTGEIFIINKLNIGTYNLQIDYNLNNIISSVYINFNIIPIIKYNNITFIIYNTYSESEIPYIESELENNGTFILADNYDNIKINDNGKLIFNYLDVGEYNIKIIYNIQNIETYFIYNLIVKPYILYNNFIPIVNPKGGIFTLINNDNINIDNLTGELLNIDKLTVGKYTFNINYKYNNIDNNFIYKYKFNPTLKYTENNIIINYKQQYISSPPIVNELGGIFYLDKQLDVLVDKSNGLLTINDIDIGIYKFNIIYEKYNSKINNTFSVIVKPVLIYNDKQIIDYHTIYTTEPPSVNPIGGIFIINTDNKKIIINHKTGIITFNNLDVGMYTISIIYSLNNSFIEYDYMLIVKPIFYYLITNEIKSGLPIINPSNGTFSIEPNTNELLNINTNDLLNINTNDLLNINTGQLDFTNYNIIGNHNFNIRYYINDIYTETIYDITVSPTINLLNEYTFLYDVPIKINIILSHIDGIISTNNINFVCYIDNDNYYLINNNIIDVGIYDLILEYYLNGVKIDKAIKINIHPKFYYDNNQLIINDFNIKYSNLPTIYPIDGTFTLSTTLNSNLNINDKGQISCSNNNLIYNNYNIEVNYIVNSIKTSLKYYINILPYFLYQPNNIELIYGFNDTSIYPIINMENGIFTIVDNTNPNINIEPNTGLITFTKYINVGSYLLNINYKSLNNNSINTTYTLQIIPTFSYNTTIIKIIYSKYYESLKPIIGGINSDNYNFTINNINGINIEPQTGIIYFNNINIIDIGNYNIIVNLNYDNKTITTNINLIIQPEIIYDTYIQNININDDFISVAPTINPNNGIFKLINNNENINIDNNGIISTNLNDIGNYNFKIQYIINNIITELDYKIICNPTLTYNNTIIELNYNENIISSIPNVAPLGGTYKIKNNPFGIKINTKGQITSTNSISCGNYNIIIMYQINQSIVSTFINIIIKPELYYKSSIFYYTSFLNGDSPIVSYNGGIYELIDLYNNIKINKDTGILSLYNVEPANYNLNIKYTVNNVSVNSNYNILIKPFIEYILSPIIKQSDKLHLVPTINPSGGIFKVTSLYDPVNLTSLYDVINLNEDGIITGCNIENAKYLINIDYIYNNINSSYLINLIVESNIYYDVYNIYFNDTQIISPYNYKNIGCFSCSELTINNNGTINIKDYEIGKYNYTIIYNYNNVNTNINLQFNIIPKFYYLIDNIVIIYYNYATSVKPFTNYSNSTSSFYFTVEKDFISIDNDGIINFDNNLKIGEYILTINYKVNDIVVSTIFTVTVKPEFFYNESLISVNYNDNIIINKPIYNPEYGIFSCTDLSNILILNSNGSIYFNKKLDIGEYNLKIDYIINNIIVDAFINITINPTIYYDNNNVRVIYGTHYESCIPIVTQYNNSILSTFKLIDNINKITIDKLNGKLFFDSSIDVGNYILDIEYEINSITANTQFIFTIIPKIYSLKYNYIFEYNNNIIIEKPITKPIGGTFSFKKDGENIIVNDFIINNLNVGKHNLELIYNYNGNINSINYELTIIPVINYNINEEYIIYKSNNLSVIPFTDPNNGIFMTDNINNKGQIIFNNYNIGNHELVIEYKINNYSNNCKVKFEIIPNFFYDNCSYIMNFNEILYSVKPFLNPPNLNFDSCLEIDNNGIIKFYNYDVGNYNFNVKYGKNIQNITLQVKPVFYYNDTNIIINYGDSKNIYPIIINKGGKFWTDDNEIIINEFNGLINLSNNNVTNKIFTIYYELNSIKNQQDINLQIKPIFNYIISKSIINYGTATHSTIPNIKPIGGIITCDNLPKNIEIEPDTGIINFINPDIGKYQFEITYTNIFKTTILYDLLVIPIYYYDKTEIFYYGFINKSILPTINPKGGKFKLIDTNNNIIIDMNGLITFNKNSPIGEYNINISYTINNQTINTYYNCKIIPFIFYENKKIIYGNNEPIIPTINTEANGLFNVDNLNLIIDNNGRISNINKLEPNNYNLVIGYTFKNITYNTNFKIIIKPYINYDNDILTLAPLNGILTCYDTDNIIEIIDNKINIISYKIGKYNFNIDYQYNITSTINLDVLISSEKLYDITNIVMYYDKPIKYIIPLIDHGIYTTDNIIDNIIVDPFGKITIDNLNIGTYNFSINYNNNNHYINNNLCITVKPKISYDTTPIYYGYNKLIPYLFPSGGSIIFRNKYKNIITNTDGSIIFNNTYPANYEFNINYTVDNITETIKINISVKPVLKLDLDGIKIKYNKNYSTDKLIVSPGNGIFKPNLSNVTIINNNMNINNNIIMGTFNLELEYSINSQSSIITKQIIVEPDFYYINNTIKITYYDIELSTIPFINPSGGTFKLLYDNNIGDIQINSNNGLLTFSKIICGNYNIKIIYILNDFKIETDYNIISEPVFYYNHLLTLNYSNNYKIISCKPCIYPVGGIYSTDNNNITINTDGEITFSNLDINTYQFKINYNVDSYNLNTIYKLIVNPSIMYNESYLNIMQNTTYNTVLPIVNPSGGKFSSDNLPNGMMINPINGIITVLKLNDTYKSGNILKYNTKIIEKGVYTININYTINNQTTTTNLFLNII